MSLATASAPVSVAALILAFIVMVKTGTGKAIAAVVLSAGAVAASL